MSAPTPAQIEYMQAHISDNHKPDLIASIAVPLSIAMIAVCLRFVARHRVRAPLLADDWWILASLVLTIGYDTASANTIHNGVGRHIILVTNPDALGKSIILSEILYCAALAPIKISILLLYHRIFPSRRVYAASIVVGLIVICYTTAQAIALGLQCIPLSSLWTGKPGRCFSTNPLFTTFAILNIVTDVSILSLPIHSLWRLQVSRSAKVQLFGTFALGGLTIVFAIIRATVTASTIESDATWGNVNGALWSNIEIPTGIVSACLPTLRPLLPKSVQTSKKTYPRESWKIAPVKTPNDSDILQMPEKPQPSRRMDKFTRMLDDDEENRMVGTDDDDEIRLHPRTTEESLRASQDERSQHSFV